MSVRPANVGASAASLFLWSLLAAAVLVAPPAGASILGLGGVPATNAEVGTPYSFVPRVIATENVAGLFVVENLPRWASFDPLWGRITGVPGPEDIGWHGQIRITLLGIDTAQTLPSFSIWVQPAGTPVEAATSQVRVSWEPPTLNDDGTPVSDLAGYVVYVGRSPHALRPYYQINDPVATSATVRSLPNGQLFVAVTAYTTTGAQSDLSKIGSVLLD